jgi:alpha-aminoadipic semialdehyde synthase
MSKFIGIRHEDKYQFEKRAPLTPNHVKELIKQKHLDIIVQTSNKRIFQDEEYLNAGAKISKDLKKCSIVFGVKEIPFNFFEPNKTYVFFSHVIKGQPYNMPMLKQMMNLKCNLIDYERIVDEQGKRLIFFGQYAGLAGMINSLWALGLRLKEFGFHSSFCKIKQAYRYHSLKEAKDEIGEIGQMIAVKGIPFELKPFVIGITGYGNVSIGAQEICGLLPIKEIHPKELVILHLRNNLPNNIIYKVVFHEEDMFEHIYGEPFDLHDYYTNPQNYKSKFEKYIPHLSMLINCAYWDKRYPRLVTKQYLKKVFSNGRPKLTVIGDISCDVEGAIECTLTPTSSADPIFIYNPKQDGRTMGSKGDGILVMAVDLLPGELPRDSSDGFSSVLVDFVKPIVDADFNLPFDDINLPKSLKKGLILHHGQLTPDFRYIEQFLFTKEKEKASFTYRKGYTSDYIEMH